MKKVVYANLSCNSLHYPAINYLVSLKKYLNNEDKLIICFWDKKIYQFQPQIPGFIKTEVKETLAKIKSILNYYNINYEIIYFSDAFNRLNKKEELQDLLYSILGNISLGALEDFYKEEKYFAMRPVTLSKMTFTVADFLISLYFNKLFPELNIGKITHYYTGIRFKAVINRIEEAISDCKLIVQYPKIIFIEQIPILNYKTGKWISVEMEKTEIEKEIEKAFPEKIDLGIVKDILGLISNLINPDEFVLVEEEKIEKINLHRLLGLIGDLKRKNLILTLTENMYNYLRFVKNNLLNIEKEEVKQTTYIKTGQDLKEMLSILNPSKLEIIRLCNGENTIQEIINKKIMKPSSTRSYISKLRAKNIITKSEKPKRRINEILISFD